MSIFLQIFESIGALTSKLKPLTQVRFWGPVGITAVVVGFIWQVSEHPEWFELDDLKQAISNSANFDDRLSEEEKAIAADIDSSAVLIKELEGPKLLPYPIDTPITAGDGAIDQLRKSRLNTSATPSTSSNPLLETESSPNTLPDFPVAPTSSELNNPLNFDPTSQTPSSPTAYPQGSPNVTPPVIFEANYPSAAGAEGETSAVSPLQAAMDEYTQEQVQPESSNSSSTTTDPTTPILNSNSSQINITNSPGLPATPTSIVTQPSVSVPQATWIVPRTPTTPTSPTTPTPTINPYQTNISITQPVIPSQAIIPTTPTPTGAAVTPDIRSIYNSYGVPNANGSFGTPFPNNASSTPTTGSLNNSLVNPQNYQVNQNTLLQNTQADQFNQMNQRPFSAPRPVPGRRIGGGEINTFANP